ncbi:PNK3P-domain-containing protein [Periconia macrospinosa]|uniref:PNK3P-domain-containing protein n=1 Tax=Periconia macrospinosa TaxID=97972 RepID=A0A2V1D362_9PLEO|nr:PNK3P-domain-containing protein [Periconia macrospinosa]
MGFMQWKMVDGGLLVGQPAVGLGYDAISDRHQRTRCKAVLFDLDGTLVKTKSGSLHAQDETDWVWWDPIVPSRLRKLYKEEGTVIVIVTNQGRLTTPKGDEAPEAALFKAKLDDICSQLDVPVVIYAACANDKWRKPRLGCWHKMQDDFKELGFFSIPWERAVLVGDAAGRETDHADADWHFSLNAAIDFHTPEEFFLHAIPEHRNHMFDPVSHLCLQPEDDDEVDKALFQILEQESPAALVMLIGLPGSGKTTFFRARVLKSYRVAYINPRGGTTTTTQASKSPLEIAQQHLREGKHVVVDDLHTRASERNSWVTLARNHSARTVAIFFTAPLDLCIHNDAVRALGTLSNDANEKRPVYPRNRFKLLAKEFEPPTTTSEDFDAVFEVGFRVSFT